LFVLDQLYQSQEHRRKARHGLALVEGLFEMLLRQIELWGVQESFLW
jgi:hypothetical protein